MKFAKSIDYDVLRQILASAPVFEVEAVISKKENLPIIPCTVLTHIQRELSAANIDLTTLNNLLEQNRAELIAYCTAVIELEKGEPADVQEFPNGEEVDEPSETLQRRGVQNGVALLYLCTFHFFKNRRYAELKEYLKWMRIPYANKYAAQLKKAFLAASK